MKKSKKKKAVNINKKKSKLRREFEELTIPKFKDVLKDLRTTVCSTVIITAIIFGVNTGIQEIIRFIL